MLLQNQVVTGDSPDFGWAVKPDGPDGRKGFTGKQFLSTLGDRGPWEGQGKCPLPAKGQPFGSARWQGFNLIRPIVRVNQWTKTLLVYILGGSSRDLFQWLITMVIVVVD